MNDIRGVYTASGGKAYDAIKGVPEEPWHPAITMVGPTNGAWPEWRRSRGVKENYGLGRVKRGTLRECSPLQEASEAPVAVDRPIKRTRIARA